MTCKQINRFLIARQCLWVQKVGTLSIDKVFGTLQQEQQRELEVLLDQLCLTFAGM
jgi:hypothetical protein